MDYARLNLKLNIDEIIQCFKEYIQIATNKQSPSKSEFLLNIEARESDPNYTGDMKALLRSEISYNQVAAFEWLKNEIL